ncbi:acyltransferase family protein [Pseudarthrobacter sp. efr-133-R2A-89]|uniref:acyltransferase family protein n=1 Tax=Pseudarthrobacter sp. efr-133-R2A-89 TaxID=3040302 RepID=UPI002553214B|nr:acyltransferase family protein [Pseudarthrobacter sp. efr-133-R2A-89]
MPRTVEMLVGRHVRATPNSRKSGSARSDIQGLRALAVGLVIVYHIWPAILPGGFVGVDVFFVISGFLIIGSLVREIATSNSLDLLSFYERRIVRLLPAATLVLLVIVLGTVTLLPQSRWQSISLDVIASGLQVQNWNQAFSANTYAHATALVSPVQHYWSLAVEEQFYIFVPIVLLGGVFLARKFKWAAASVCVAVIGGLTVCSFVHSIFLSISDHDVAYFATSTRIWELGAGGLVAVLLKGGLPGRKPKLVAGWAGVAGIVFAALTFSTSMAFPGYVALIPVAATILILCAGGQDAAPGFLSVPALLSWRPVTFIGDVSYSLYLWHWPIVVFYVYFLGREPGFFHGAAILLLSTLCATLSYQVVEQRFRHVRHSRTRNQARTIKVRFRSAATFLVAAGVVVATSGSALVPWGIVEAKAQELQSLLNTREYPGAMAFDPGHEKSVPAGLPVRPEAALALKDVPMTAGDGCGVYDPAAMGPEKCVYGAPDSTRSMVVVGDSHAAQYVDPMVLAGKQAGWQIHAMVRNGCPFSAVPPADETTVYSNCSAQNQVSLRRILDLRPDLVVIAGMVPRGYEEALHWRWDTPDALVKGYVDLMKPLRNEGLRVAVILDNPYPAFSVPDCVQRRSPSAPECQVARATGDDPLQRAADQVPGVEVLDMSDYLCRQETCPAIIGNVLVYRDNHLTNTFAKSLAPVLSRKLRL